MLDIDDDLPEVMPRKKKLAIGALVVGVIVLLLLIVSTLMAEEQVAAAPPLPPQPTFVEHTVQSGEYLVAIAEQYQVSLDELILLNEGTLKANAADHCRRTQKRGYYCNDKLTLNGQAIMFANSLKPGDVLRVPISRSEHFVAVAP